LCLISDFNSSLLLTMFEIETVTFSILNLITVIYLVTESMLVYISVI
jgi:hypothetical protein